MTCVTDTHPMVWLLENNPRLSSPARDALEDPGSQIVVPALVLAEIGHLYGRQRISVDIPSVLHYIRTATNCRVSSLDEAVIAHLPTSLDIHDAIIVATALYYRDGLGEAVGLITRDAAIQASSLVPVIW